MILNKAKDVYNEKKICLGVIFFHVFASSFFFFFE